MFKSNVAGKSRGDQLAVAMRKAIIFSWGTDVYKRKFETITSARTPHKVVWN